MFKDEFDDDTRGVVLKPIEKQDASWKIIPRELRPVYDLASLLYDAS
ncbi:MAG: hypothetical protein ACI4NP_00440 [Thermoguttaceae bacterium]